MGNYYAGMMNNTGGYGELKHHGILGQKWGVRRWQNADGSLTAAGKERYGYSGDGEKDSKGKLDSETAGLLSTLAVTAVGCGVAIATVAKQYEVSMGIAAKALAMTYPVHTAELVGIAAISAGLLAYKTGGAIKSHYKNKKFEEERLNNPIDKKTGFHKKTQNLSEEEDLERVNPQHNNFNQNTKSNCMLCTTAYEMRRRGYDVRAGKTSTGYDKDDVKMWFPKAKVINIENKSKTPSTWYTNKLIETIEKSEPNNSRGNLMIVYNDYMGNTLGGHSVAYEVKNGKMRILDAQINKIYNDPKEALQSVGYASYTRLDNVAFDPKAIKECCS